MSEQEIIAVEAIRIENNLPAPTFEVVPVAMVQRLRSIEANMEAMGEVCAESIDYANRYVCELADVLKEIEKHRQLVKKPVLDLGRAIDDCAKNAVAGQKELLDGVKKQIASVQAQEQERINRHQRNLGMIYSCPERHAADDSQQLRQAIVDMRAFCQPLDWQEFADDARCALEQAEATMLHMIDLALKKEAEEAAAEAARMAAKAEAKRAQEQSEKAAALFGDDDDGAAEAEAAEIRRRAEVAAFEAQERAKQADEQRRAAIAAQAAQAEAARRQSEKEAQAARKSSAVRTRTKQTLRIDDARAVAQCYEVAGAVLVKVDEPQVLRLLKAGIEIPGAKLVNEEIAVMARGQ